MRLLPKRYIFGLALRYLSSRQNNRFISFISLTSLIGVGLGVMVLITVMSIMNGFQSELRSRILGMTAHISIHEDNHQLRDWRSVRESLFAYEDIIGSAPFIEKQALISAGENVKGVLIKGVDPELELEVSSLAEYLTSGSMEDLREGDYSIFLGTQLAYQLGVGLGDKVTVVVPQVNSGFIAPVPRLKRFTVRGIVDAGMYEYDSGYAFINIMDAARLYRLYDRISGLQLRTSDMFAVPQIIRGISAYLPDRTYFALSWTQQHANFFQAIQLEKRMMFIVLALIIAVAAFNIVSTMVMMVNEKARSIAILRTQGARAGEIMQLFFLQGILIGTLGITLGCIGGYFFSTNIGVIAPFLEKIFSIQFFPPDVYYISRVPSELHLEDVVKVSLFAFFTTIIATIYPAVRAARISPAQVLRYE